MLKKYPEDINKLKITLSPTTVWSERMSYAYSTCLFFFLSGVVSYYTNFDKPIRCILTSETPGPWADYFEELCYINGTYVTKDLYETREHIVKHAVSVHYYQFVPYVMLIQTFLWYSPHMFWRFTSNLPVFHLPSIMKLKFKKEKGGDEKGDKKEANEIIEEYYVDHVHRCLQLAHRVQWMPWTALYFLVTKWLYVVIAFAQLTIITVFIGQSDYLWGFKEFANAATSGEWKQLSATIFPYTATCDALEVNFGQINMRTFPCVLVMNMLLDKVYVFLWFWVTTMLILQISAAIYWTLMLTIPFLRSMQMSNILQLETNSPKRRLVPYFVSKHLGIDGFLFLCLLKENSSFMEAHDFAHDLWKKIEGL